MAASLGRSITLEDLLRALKEMASGKSQGPDGIMSELYKSLW
jgi:hypothetical protein